MDVIVVRGGPVGLMTAALLDVAGVRVEVGQANVVPLGGSAARVHGTHAGDSQLAAGHARRRKAPFSLPALSATLTGISGIGFGAHSPSWLARTSNTGRRDAASLAWNWLPRAPSARTHMQRTASRSSRP